MEESQGYRERLQTPPAKSTQSDTESFLFWIKASPLMDCRSTSLGDCLKRVLTYIARRPSKRLPPSLLPAAARSDFYNSGDPQEPELGI